MAFALALLACIIPCPCHWQQEADSAPLDSSSYEGDVQTPPAEGSDASGHETDAYARYFFDDEPLNFSAPPCKLLAWVPISRRAVRVSFRSEILRSGDEL